MLIGVGWRWGITSAIGRCGRWRKLNDERRYHLLRQRGRRGRGTENIGTNTGCGGCCGYAWHISDVVDIVDADPANTGFNVLDDGIPSQGMPAFVGLFNGIRKATRAAVVIDQRKSPQVLI